MNPRMMNWNGHQSARQAVVVQLVQPDLLDRRSPNTKLQDHVSAQTSPVNWSNYVPVGIGLLTCTLAVAVGLFAGFVIVEGVVEIFSELKRYQAIDFVNTISGS